MNLTSCRGCGIVLDKDMLDFPEDLFDEDGIIDDNKAVWRNDEYVAKVYCPICRTHILEKG